MEDGARPTYLTSNRWLIFRKNIMLITNFGLLFTIFE